MNYKEIITFLAWYWMKKQLAEKEGITEQLKAEDQMEWVQCMNNIRNRAEEIVNAKVILMWLKNASWNLEE